MVVSTWLKNMGQIGSNFPKVRVENKKYLKPPPRLHPWKLTNVPKERDYFTREYIWTNHWCSGDIRLFSGEVIHRNHSRTELNGFLFTPSFPCRHRCHHQGNDTIESPAGNPEIERIERGTLGNISQMRRRCGIFTYIHLTYITEKCEPKSR